MIFRDPRPERQARCREKCLARHVILGDQSIDRLDQPRAKFHDRSGAAIAFPGQRVRRERFVFLGGSAGDILQLRVFNQLLKISKRDDLHPMPALA